MRAGALLGIDKAAVASRFNRSAVTYDDHCRVQRLLAGRLMARLEAESPPGVILELGCGTGHLTQLMSSRFPGARILAVDFAERMIQLARRRVDGERVEFAVADAETAAFEPESFDVVVSNATIQWFDDPRSTFKRLAGVLRPGGVMLHSTFGPDTFCEWRSLFDNDRASGLPLRSAGEWAGVLAGAGLGRVGTAAGPVQLTYRGAGEFFTELNATGATCRPEGIQAPLPPRALRRALDLYEQRFRSPGGLPVTYELVEVWGSQTDAWDHVKIDQQ